MKLRLGFDLTVNKVNNTIHVKREFAAGNNCIWAAWTTSGLLEQWSAPKPYHLETKSFEFREGGRWLYAIVSAENQKQWSKAYYKKIESQKEIVVLDAFCDENGNALFFPDN